MEVCLQETLCVKIDSIGSSFVFDRKIKSIENFLIRRPKFPVSHPMLRVKTKTKTYRMGISGF